MVKDVVVDNSVFVSDKAKQFINSCLQDNICTVTFIKKNGETREMHCTLNEQFIPIELLPKGTNRAVSENSRTVFDTDKNEWRSFRWDSLNSFEFNITSGHVKE